MPLITAEICTGGAFLPYFPNKSGQLADEVFEFDNERESSDRFSKLKGVVGSLKIAKIASGDRFSLFLDQFGDVYSVGRGNEGQLGFQVDLEDTGKTQFKASGCCQIVPQRIPTFFENKIKIQNIHCGGDFSVCESSSGRLFSFGDNSKMQLGRRTEQNFSITPGEIEHLPTEQRKIVCGYHFFAVLTESDDLFVAGQIEGNKSTGLKYSLDKVESNISDIAAGFNHLGAIKEGKLLTIGSNVFVPC